jgi:hypothetical protein
VDIPYGKTVDNRYRTERYTTNNHFTYSCSNNSSIDSVSYNSKAYDSQTLVQRTVYLGTNNYKSDNCTSLYTHPFNKFSNRNSVNPSYNRLANYKNTHRHPDYRALISPFVSTFVIPNDPAFDGESNRITNIITKPGDFIFVAA